MVVKTIRVQTETRIFERVAEVKRKDRDAQTQSETTFRRRIPVKLAPKLCGRETSTQIEEGELFDFDAEVEPILEVLVGRAIEEAAIELSRERELDHLRAKQAEYDRLRQAEIIETQRLEQLEVRKQQERQRRVAQELARLEASRIAQEEAMTTEAVKDLLLVVSNAACNKLESQGAFRSPLLAAIEDDYLPGLISIATVEHNTLEPEYEKIADEILTRDPSTDEAVPILDRLARKLEVNNFIASLLKGTDIILQDTLENGESLCDS